jgi:hypothetical protein
VTRASERLRRPLASTALLVVVLLAATPPPDLGAQGRSLPDSGALEELLGGLDDREFPRMDEVRRLYHLAVEDVSRLPELEALVESSEGTGLEWPSDPTLIMAYRGALDVVRARHSRWPLTRLAMVRSGLSRLDEAVSEDPSSTEIRYLRLASEAHLPRLLRREEVVDRDLAVLIQALALDRHGLTPGMDRIVAGFLDYVLDML